MLYLANMKYCILLLYLFSLSLAASAKGDDEITFLVLFNKTELEKVGTSTAYIELNFFEKFTTRSYAGNSDAALLITLPKGEMDECAMGETLVQINRTTWVPLSEIAFRIIDLNESAENYQALIAKMGDGQMKKKNQLVRLKL